MTTTITWTLAVESFFLLLIGIGPKIALVPYLQATADMDSATKQRVLRKMLVTAALVALVLIVFGELLTRLLHFSPGALSVAGGVILFIIAAAMVLGRKQTRTPSDRPARTRIRCSWRCSRLPCPTCSTRPASSRW